MPTTVLPPMQQLGGPGQVLAPDEVRAFVGHALGAADLDGKRLCVIVPDSTRSCPLPLVLDAVHRAVQGRVSALTVLVALGTHQAMSDRDIAAWLGCDGGGVAERYPGMRALNHEWWDDSALVQLGAIGAERLGELSDGRLREEVPVRVNRHVLEHDVALVVGPVFPHEVVGFSGGNKYFFPGVAGPEIIDVSHWLGALITSAEIIGTTGITPVRALIDEAAAMIPATRLALCLVVQSGAGALHSVTFGSPEAAWAAAAEVSARTHVRYLDRPVQRALAIMPDRYQDMWTAAKGFYKLEPVIADGGEVVIFAPHITEVSRMHPEILDVGYHTRDYFMHNWPSFSHLHWGVLAHSTHLRGAGTYEPGIGERPRVKVTLATGIPESIVRAVNLDYLDPADVDVAAFEDDPTNLVVPQAGEVLYRLR